MSINYLKKKIIIIAASAGGIPALIELFKNMHDNHPPIVIALHHTKNSHRKKLAFVYQSGKFKEAHIPEEGEYPKADCLYYAPSDKNLNIDNNKKFYYKPFGFRQRFAPWIDDIFINFLEYYQVDIQ